MTRAITVIDIIKALNKFQSTDGFASAGDEFGDFIEFIGINRTELIITKQEWNRALIWQGIESLRTRREWWDQFVDLGYLVPVDDKSNEAYLQVKMVLSDISNHRNLTVEQILGV